MAFFEYRIDDRIAQGARGGPVWKTSGAKSGSGHRATNRDWLYPLHRFDISHAVKTRDQFESLLALAWVVGGSADGFRMRDWADFRLTPATSNLVHITGSQWQTHRIYSIGGRTATRPIRKLVADPVVTRTRSGIESTATTTSDLNTGVITVAGHVSGDTYTCTGEFDVPVHFESDAFIATLLSANRGGGGIVIPPELTLVEYRL